MKTMQLEGRIYKNSFASNGECGLKPEVAAAIQRPCVNSFASNGECGLKRQMGTPRRIPAHQFIRQQWRMWIETSRCRPVPPTPTNSFASNGECGLKLLSIVSIRIKPLLNSFASNGECGLKLLLVPQIGVPCLNSFASNGECGLKRIIKQTQIIQFKIHSPAMANVD